jgi:hypothetical protein
MKLLDTDYPGHKIATQVVADYVARCAICQKNRQGMVDSIQPIVRHLKPEHKRKTIGVDTLTITPTDKFGNTYLFVIVVHFTKLAWGYPSPTKNASALAKALVTFFSLYGVYDTIVSDPGSDLTSDLTNELEKYFGIKHVFSLVNRHESNGVEGTNKQILRHLRALVHEERIVDQWSSPTVLPVVFHIINSHVSSETGISPYAAHFGSDDATYFSMPEGLSEKDQPSEFVRLLNDNIRSLNETSKRFQDELIKERTKDNCPEKQNMYQPGDFVLLKRDTDYPRPTKLSPQYMGPYEVIKQTKNDVKVRHMSGGVVKELHVENLKRYLGDAAQAKEAANIDYDQHEVDRILGYRGNPTRRSEMQFELLFRAGDTLWKYYCKDIYETLYFEEFCMSRPELRRLLTSESVSKAKASAINKAPIISIHTGDSAFMNLRFYGYDKYSTFGLPEHERLIYLVPITFGRHTANGKCITVHDEVLNYSFQAKHQTVIEYCSYRTVDEDKGMRLITLEDLVKWPSLRLH